MARSAIEWTESTWNPVTGCDKISPGCKHCYAERMARRLQGMGQADYRRGFRLTLQPSMLERHLSWRTPRMIFVNSMSDLFHRDVPFGFIERVFQVMKNANWHTFQVLTKRTDRLGAVAGDRPWPSNVWMGVSVERQDYAFRVDHLRRIPAAQSRALAEISLSAARAGADLTRMLVAYARRQTLQPSEFCAADLLGEMRGLIERSLGSGIALEIEADGDPWGVRADRPQLARVLLNLVLNARDAMPRGGRLAIQVRNVALDAEKQAPGIVAGHYVMIAVSDTGTGIAAAVLERAFEPFFTTKEVGKGSGLGLAMVQGFAHQSGGHVVIQSRPGEGTVVQCSTPSRKPAAHNWA